MILAGPFSSTLQNIIIGLTSLGADVALIDKEGQQATKFCQNITDQREVNEKQGRAMAIKADLTDRKQLKEAVGQVAQTFGSIDIYIDAHLMNQPTPMLLTNDETDLDPIITMNLKIPLMLTQNIIAYLKGRKRGLNVRHNRFYCWPILLPGEMNRHTILLIEWTHPKVIRRDHAYF